ncbi:hypothetical protein, partial [Alistipes sp.]
PLRAGAPASDFRFLEHPDNQRRPVNQHSVHDRDKKHLETAGQQRRRIPPLRVNVGGQEIEISRKYKDTARLRFESPAGE